MIRHTLAKEISDYWLIVLKKLAYQREMSVAITGRRRLPPEFARVRNIAVRNFAGSHCAVSFLSFMKAKEFAKDLTMGTGEICSLVSLTRINTPPRGKEYIRHCEFALYPGKDVPKSIPGIRVSKPLTISGILYE